MIILKKLYIRERVMNKTIKVLKRITPIILTIVIVVFNIPVESLYVTDICMKERNHEKV